MRVIILDSYDEISYWTASYIKNKINSNKHRFILGLPTGSTPLLVYKWLIKFYKNNELSFENVISFNLDEYVGLDKFHHQSYRTYMYDNFFSKINMKEENINLLNGNAIDLEQECIEYERKIQDMGGIDLCLLGIGRNGHLAFNEPYTPIESSTHVVKLSKQTIIDNSRFFDNNSDLVPTKAITMGLKTISNCREILLLSSGRYKSHATHQCIEGHLSNQYPCILFQSHKKGTVICDDEACNKLNYGTVKYYKNIEYNLDLFGNPIINPISEFIDNNDKILFTSPHADDDCIGCGGTMQLIKNKDLCNIVYMTSGNSQFKQKDNIRIREAISAVNILGYEPNQVISGDLPFYYDVNRTITNNDVVKMSNIIQELKPNHIFIAIDKDPKETHIKCFEILQQVKFPHYVKKIWLYKSAWEDWDKNTFNYSVYFDKNILDKKILSINQHISQKNLIVNNGHITSMKDVVNNFRKSEICPNYYFENFRIIEPSELVSYVR